MSTFLDREIDFLVRAGLNETTPSPIVVEKLQRVISLHERERLEEFLKVHLPENAEKYSEKEYAQGMDLISGYLSFLQNEEREAYFINTGVLNKIALDRETLSLQEKRIRQKLAALKAYTENPDSPERRIIFSPDNREWRIQTTDGLKRLEVLEKAGVFTLPIERSEPIATSWSIGPASNGTPGDPKNLDARFIADNPASMEDQNPSTFFQYSRVNSDSLVLELIGEFPEQVVNSLEASFVNLPFSNSKDMKLYYYENGVWSFWGEKAEIDGEVQIILPPVKTRKIKLLIESSGSSAIRVFENDYVQRALIAIADINLQRTSFSKSGSLFSKIRENIVGSYLSLENDLSNDFYEVSVFGRSNNEQDWKKLSSLDKEERDFLYTNKTLEIDLKISRKNENFQGEGNLVKELKETRVLKGNLGGNEFYLGTGFLDTVLFEEMAFSWGSRTSLGVFISNQRVYLPNGINPDSTHLFRVVDSEDNSVTIQRERGRLFVQIPQEDEYFLEIKPSPYYLGRDGLVATNWVMPEEEALEQIVSTSHAGMEVVPVGFKRVMLLGPDNHLNTVSVEPFNIYSIEPDGRTIEFSSPLTEETKISFTYSKSERFKATYNLKDGKLALKDPEGRFKVKEVLGKTEERKRNRGFDIAENLGSFTLDSSGKRAVLSYSSIVPDSVHIFAERIQVPYFNGFYEFLNGIRVEIELLPVASSAGVYTWAVDALEELNETLGVFPTNSLWVTRKNWGDTLLSEGDWSFSFLEKKFKLKTAQTINEVQKLTAFKSPTEITYTSDIERRYSVDHERGIIYFATELNEPAEVSYEVCMVRASGPGGRITRHTRENEVLRVLHSDVLFPSSQFSCVANRSYGTMSLPELLNYASITISQLSMRCIGL